MDIRGNTKHLFRFCIVGLVTITILCACSRFLNEPSKEGITSLKEERQGVLNEIFVTRSAEGNSKLYLGFNRLLPKETVTVQKIKGSSTIAVVVHGVPNISRAKGSDLKKQLMNSYRVEQHEKNTVIYTHFDDNVKYQIFNDGKDFIINFFPSNQSADADLYTNNEIESVKVSQQINGDADVSIQLRDTDIAFKVKKYNDKVTLLFPMTTLSREVKDEQDFGFKFDTVKQISVNRSGKNAEITVYSKIKFKMSTHRFGNKVILTMQPLNLSETVEINKQQEFTGQRISLNFQSISVRSLLQIIASYTKLNIVISDKVTGSMSIRLNNIPWDQVLNIVLKSQGLSMRRDGNVLLIAPSTDLITQEIQELKSKQQLLDLSPLYTEIFNLHYASAKSVHDLLKSENSSILSAKGQITMDERTNALWVRDTKQNLKEIRDIISQVDIPVKQVLIEARIVTVNDDYTHNLGVKFGITSLKRTSGTLTGANQLATGTALDSVPVDNRLNFDLGLDKTTTALSGAGSIGLALFKIDNKTTLDLELSALETEGYGKVISSPRLITSDQKPAHIQTGEEIPYEESTSSGATSISFKKAVLSLTVTPRITPGNRVILVLKVTEDTKGETIGTTPAINTQEVETEVLLNDGETIVLGGVYKHTNKHNIERIPFLGSIPVVGNLFKKKSIENTKSELLIFVTPSIIQDSLHARNSKEMIK